MKKTISEKLIEKTAKAICRHTDVEAAKWCKAHGDNHKRCPYAELSDYQKSLWLTIAEWHLKRTVKA